LRLRVRQDQIFAAKEIMAAYQRGELALEADDDAWNTGEVGGPDE
jgi:hypothetical protein